MVLSGALGSDDDSSVSILPSLGDTGESAIVCVNNVSPFALSPDSTEPLATIPVLANAAPTLLHPYLLTPKLGRNDSHFFVNVTKVTVYHPQKQ